MVGDGIATKVEFQILGAPVERENGHTVSSIERAFEFQAHPAIHPRWDADVGQDHVPHRLRTQAGLGQGQGQGSGRLHCHAGHFDQEKETGLAGVAGQRGG